MKNKWLNSYGYQLSCPSEMIENVIKIMKSKYSVINWSVFNVGDAFYGENVYRCVFADHFMKRIMFATEEEYNNEFNLRHNCNNKIQESNNIMTFKDFKDTETFKKSRNTVICINDDVLLYESEIAEYGDKLDNLTVESYNEDEFDGLVVDLICSNWNDRRNADWIGESPDEKERIELQSDVKESYSDTLITTINNMEKDIESLPNDIDSEVITKLYEDLEELKRIGSKCAIVLVGK